jgi:hypothetical protein
MNESQKNQDTSDDNVLRPKPLEQNDERILAGLNLNDTDSNTSHLGENSSYLSTFSQFYENLKINKSEKVSN